MPGTLGFQGLVVGFVLAVFLLIRRQWRSAAARKEEVLRLVSVASEESASAEVGAVADYSSLPKVYRCAVCLCRTTTRCSQCKAVRYCSSKCQILHWRRCHKDECHPLTPTGYEEENDKIFGFTGNDSKMLEFGRHSKDSRVDYAYDSLKLYADSKRIDTDFPSSQTANGSSVKVSPIRVHKSGLNDVSCDTVGIRQSTQKLPARSSIDQDNNHEVRILNKMKSCNGYEESRFSSQKYKAASFSDAQPKVSDNKKSSRSGASSRMLNADNYVSVKSSSSTSNGEGDAEMFADAYANTSSQSELPAKASHKPNMSQPAHTVLKTSVQKIVQHFRASKPSRLSHFSGAVNEISFPYELFVKLYSCGGMELHPFGLVNCGNSCYANAVLQCLAFTRPLTSYLVKGLHSKACRKKAWCFICEFECLILKAREGNSPQSPIKILSKIQKIGRHLGPGREEDAHEFLRYAVDTMQSVFLKEADAAGPFAEETTLIGLTFGGYLHSKIKCMNCYHKSERCERMMDLTVEIDGDIGSLEEALAQFTAYEILHGENRYYCGRCKSYQKAKKRLTILEAPNVLTIVLKRFQSDNFGKLSKSIQFPEVLNMAPYMSGSSDTSPMYSLYAVVVHLDVMNAAFSGHYVCYVKTLHGDWFRIDDSTVMPVGLDTVLLEGAYMLLYARHSPRAPTSVRKNMESHARRSKERNLEAIPSSRNNYNNNNSLSEDNNSTQRTDRSVSKQKHGNTSLCDPSHWRLRAVQMDSSSESSYSSSLLSCSDASSCSSTSTKDSRPEEFSNYLFGGVEPGWYARFGSDSDDIGIRNDQFDYDVRYGISSRRTSGLGSAQTFY